ncbi:hypothetical protein OROHE_001333 [Orobanche hederae]
MSNVNAIAAAAAAAGGHMLFESEREVVASVEDLIQKLPINENLVKRGAGTVNNAVANQVLVNRAHVMEVRVTSHLSLLREIVEACDDDAALFMREYINAVSELNGRPNFSENIKKFFVNAHDYTHAYHRYM